jgi:hypothetical protein
MKPKLCGQDGVLTVKVCGAHSNQRASNVNKSIWRIIIIVLPTVTDEPYHTLKRFIWTSSKYITDAHQI